MVSINGIIFDSDDGAIAIIAKAEFKDEDTVRADYEAVKADECNNVLYGKYYIKEIE